MHDITITTYNNKKNKDEDTSLNNEIMVIFNFRIQTKNLLNFCQ